MGFYKKVLIALISALTLYIGNVKKKKKRKKKEAHPQHEKKGGGVVVRSPLSLSYAPGISIVHVFPFLHIPFTTTCFEFII